MEFDFSIGIVNWNTEAMLQKALRSIEDHGALFKIQVLVADNGSQDGSIAMLRSEFPNVQRLENHQNLGFAKAHNALWKMSRAPIHILLNSDVELLPHVLDGVHQAFSQNDRLGIYGPKMLDAHGTLQPSCRRFPTLWRQFCHSMGFHKLMPQSTTFNGTLMADFDHLSCQVVDQVIGSFFAVKCEVWQKIGFLDEAFFMYYEEVDFCLRARNAGFSTYFDADHAVVHLGGGSSERVKTLTIRRTMRSLRYFFLKHYGVLTWPILFVLLSLEGVTRTVFHLLHRKNPVPFIGAWLLASLDFLLWKPANQRIG